MELGDLNVDLISDPTQPSKDLANDDTLNPNDKEGLNLVEEIVDLTLL